MPTVRSITWNAALENLLALEAALAPFVELLNPTPAVKQLEAQWRSQTDDVAMAVSPGVDTVTRFPPVALALLRLRVHYAKQVVQTLCVPSGAGSESPIAQPFDTPERLGQWLLVDLWRCCGAPNFQGAVRPDGRFEHAHN
jgi:hypothetical protein